MLMMKNITSNFTIISALILSVSLYDCSNKSEAPKKTSNYETIKSGFVTPTDDNTLWCYWYWIGDDISKEGITKDLEAMKAAGIGGALIGNINPDKRIVGNIKANNDIIKATWWVCAFVEIRTPSASATRINKNISKSRRPALPTRGNPKMTLPSPTMIRAFINDNIKYGTTLATITCPGFIGDASNTSIVPSSFSFVSEMEVNIAETIIKIIAITPGIK